MIARLLNFLLAISLFSTSFVQSALAENKEGNANPSLPPASKKKIDFVRDIEPIFAKHCNDCHGPDSQEGRLRLDAIKIVFKGGISGPLIVRGNSQKSLLIERIVEMGDEIRMPLDADPLTDEQIGLIRAWIDQGANWPDGVGSDVSEIEKHWAYVKPIRPALPAVKNSSWVRNAIDSFVLARLEKEGLKPSPVADRAKLIRRVYLDLIGLPPSIEEVDAFLNDSSPTAYNQVVKRLLSSPRYGERWARHWLDLARYADSNGYQADQFREVWPYRDWVIQAMNEDMPFDQFTIEQIAGDLLPNATTSQKIATGFHRQTTCNVEAGVDPEENRVNQIIDRVNTTGTVWLGTSIECGQCHSHKYDPFTQRDYYRLFAFFNNTLIEVKHASNTTYDFYGPKMSLGFTPDQKTELSKLKKEHAEFDAQLKPKLKLATASQDSWERDQLAALATEGEASKKKITESKAGGSSDATKSTPQEILKEDTPKAIVAILKTAKKKRKANQKTQLLNHYLQKNYPEVKKLKDKADTLNKQIAAIKAPSTLVMVEQEKLRDTHIFKRGNFRTPADQVDAGTPVILHEMSADLPKNRLGLAQWLVDKENPLVARVTVNRWWADIFGQGIISTEEDFGTQGELPTHPQLLDWLAVEFVESGWSMKHIHHLIVTSNTYRQSSRITPESLERDQVNRLLARGPRFRLPAEMIRDNALAISGLLSVKMAGPPVYPPQPPGVWRHVGRNAPKYNTNSNEDRFRRGIYVIWRRSAPYPSFMNFDAPERSACVVKRPRTNTPLQALTLMNDEAYVEISMALAKQIASNSEASTVSDQIVSAFRQCVTRSPKPNEARLLENVFQEQLERFRKDPKAAKTLIGKTVLPKGITAEELGAWFYVANILLNLDETITKG